MKILIISAGTDPAGVGIATKRALERHTDHEVRCVRRINREYDYPADIHWGLADSRTGDEVMALFRAADVVHMIDRFVDLPGWEGKPRVLQHHGAWFHKHPDATYHRAQREGIPQFVATHDLAQPDAPWVPNPVDLDELRALRRAVYRPGPVRVIQTPSSRTQKNTDALLAAWPTAQVVDRVPWTESLRAKAAADILFDSFTFGYGNTSIEAMAMGLAVVSGVSDPAIEAKVREHLGFLPYEPATPETLGAVLARLVADPLARAEVAYRGRACVEQFHAEAQVVRRLLPIYEAARNRSAVAA